MALTSPKMSLNIWNQLTDPYDHEQLADNWAKVDFHDHTPGRGVQIPTEGLADGAVTSAKLASTLDPSLGYSTYKTVESGSAYSAGFSAGTYVIPKNYPAVQFSTVPLLASYAAFYFDPVDHAVSGRSTVLRLRVGTIVNAVAPATTLTYGLYPIATWGGASGSAATIATLGTVVSGSTSAVVSPPTGPTVTASSDFTAPAAGWYAFAVVNSGAVASGSIITASVSLQVRQT